jgi:hypothetical protein
LKQKEPKNSRLRENWLKNKIKGKKKRTRWRSNSFSFHPLSNDNSNFTFQRLI